MYCTPLRDYDDIMSGAKKEYPKKEFKMTPVENEQIALSIIKHCIEGYLKWSPEEAYQLFSYKVAEKMRLTIPLKNISFPKEYDRILDANYVIAKLYPKEIRLSRVAQVQKIYKRLVSGEKAKYPKGFFEGDSGCENACLCLCKAIDDKLFFKDTRSAYLFFNSNEASKFLSEAGLNKAWKDNFDSPLEFFHMSLPEENQDELLFKKLKFDSSFLKLIEAIE